VLSFDSKNISILIRLLLLLMLSACGNYVEEQPTIQLTCENHLVRCENNSLDETALMNCASVHAHCIWKRGSGCDDCEVTAYQETCRDRCGELNEN